MPIMLSIRLLTVAALSGTILVVMCGLTRVAAEPTQNERATAETSSKTPAPAAKAVWGSDFGQAKEQSAKLNRPILLHFHATWCAPCQQMERGVLNSAHVLKALDAHCVGVKIDSDRHPGLVQQFRVAVLPCDVFVTPEGKVLHVSNGVVGVNAYAAMISRIAKPKVAQPVEVTGN